MYEAMFYWETYGGDEPVWADFARIWGAIDEVAIHAIPVVAGQGRPMFRNRVFLKLERMEGLLFGNGVAFTRCRVKG